MDREFGGHQLGSGSRELSLFDGVNRDRQTREIVGRIPRQKALSKGVGALLIAVRKRGGESALDKVRIAGVDLKRLAIINFG